MMIRGDERYWANMVLEVIEHVECPMLMYEGEKMIVRKALKTYLEDRKDEPTISKMEQVDEPQTCSVSGRPYTDCSRCEYFRCTADEPQTSCKTCRYGEVDEGYVRCAYYSKSTKQDKPQTENSTNNSTISEKLQLTGEQSGKE